MSGFASAVRCADSRPAGTDELLAWAAAIWAMPADELEALAGLLEDALGDEDADVYRLASLLLEAVECARVGVMPGIETMRRAGLAVAAIRRKGEDE